MRGDHGFHLPLSRYFVSFSVTNASSRRLRRSSGAGQNAIAATGTDRHPPVEGIDEKTHLRSTPSDELVCADVLHIESGQKRQALAIGQRWSLVHGMLEPMEDRHTGVCQVAHGGIVAAAVQPPVMPCLFEQLSDVFIACLAKVRKVWGRMNSCVWCPRSSLVQNPSKWNSQSAPQVS
jgi:hypothetical protein